MPLAPRNTMIYQPWLWSPPYWPGHPDSCLGLDAHDGSSASFALMVICHHPICHVRILSFPLTRGSSFLGWHLLLSSLVPPKDTPHQTSLGCQCFLHLYPLLLSEGNVPSAFLRNSIHWWFLWSYTINRL